MARPRAFDEATVLDRALNLFWHRGYEATSMQNLVDGLGINRASLYGSFGDKYGLYQKVLDRYRQQTHTAIGRLLCQARPAPDLIRELLETAVLESVTDGQSKGCFFVNSGIELAPHDPQIARIVRDNQRTLEAQLETVIRRGQAEGDISSVHNPTDLARFIYNTLTGLKTTGKSNPDEAALRSVVTVTMASLTA